MPNLSNYTIGHGDFKDSVFIVYKIRLMRDGHVQVRSDTWEDKCLP